MGKNLEYIVSMQNLTGGEGLNKACTDDAAAPYLCLHSPYAAYYMNVPAFFANSKFDAWQLSNVLRLPCYQAYRDFPWEHPMTCDDNEQASTMQFATDFLEQLAYVFKKPENAGYITSCVCHDCRWDQITIQGKTAPEHWFAWYSGQLVGNSSILLDNAGPNRNGNPENDHCVSFP